MPFNNKYCSLAIQQFIDSKLSKKILQEAKRQQNELEKESDAIESGETSMQESIGLDENITHKINLDSANCDKINDDDDSDDYDNQDDFDLLDENEESTKNICESFYEELKISKEDERALEMFMVKDSLKRKTLSEYIKDKLTEKEKELNSILDNDEEKESKNLDSKIVELYRGVKVVLQRYRHGRLPKAFKIIPSLSNWEQILFITEPDCWSAAAMYQATKLFASNLKERMAQRFYNQILLPRVRDDIEEYKRLNFHLYQALRKALFKPGAFFKGIIIPLCESGDCTLREAVIIGSVLGRNHMPLLHSCAAMLKIAEMDYSGVNSIFLNILIRKKYALPFRVIDALFYHFYRFLNDRRTVLPVLWHQCLLAFVQNYKNDLSAEQKESLLELLRVQSHHAITPEIRHELFQSNNRDGTEFIAEDCSKNDMPSKMLD
ncbi:Bystin [Sarcoptes scabiei]|uniref:Bystin n=1 Tax=Sarcoptes scabiei TaxID=52283 RepID=A0A834VG06_SARSC|nr:Bystin [Sarcoptes scabiei]